MASTPSREPVDNSRTGKSKEKCHELCHGGTAAERHQGRVLLALDALDASGAKCGKRSCNLGGMSNLNDPTGWASASVPPSLVRGKVREVAVAVPLRPVAVQCGHLVAFG